MTLSLRPYDDKRIYDSQSSDSSCAGTRTVNLIDGTGLVPSGMKRSGNEGPEALTFHLFPSSLPFEEERKERDETRVGGGAGHYSPPTSVDHNFHTGAPIEAPFVATRSLSPPLCF
ncbi:hypothetical protein PIB30_058290 [Stylosanthes scabra]|uniref:Uncharacterized protein n=1 Tax=Stylosanthes scabra TaxID=79078 RepID=A0ABU6YKF4_9FABA|nr:hypothetical protein [Stylosanthes scabra]